MRNLNYKMLLFLLPLILIGVAMEIMLRQIPNVYQFKKEYLDLNSDSVEILFLGNSHSYFGLNPEYVTSKSFNAAHVSQTLEYDLAILRKYETEWAELKHILLPISYFSLFDKMNESGESWRAKDYCLYYDIEISKNLAHHTEMLSGELTIKFKRLWSYYVKHIDNLACSPTGWGTAYRNGRASTNLTQAGTSAAAKHRRIDDHNFSEVCSTLDSIISFTEKYGVDLIMFTPPAFKSYRSHLNNNQMDRTVMTASRMADSRPNCTYINLLENEHFTEVDFYDADHLNEIGARKLTQLMDSIIGNKSKGNSH